MPNLPFFALAIFLLLHVGCASIQRNVLFYPTHHSNDNGLAAWHSDDGKFIGYSRQVHEPENVWLMIHGNGGQAADRAYAMASFSDHDSVFILEYPGYGARGGRPSKASFDAATTEAFALLKKEFPDAAACVVGESIGSGPACVLAAQSSPPEKIVLITPFDKLTSVAAQHVGVFAANLLLEAKWNNIQSLSRYSGKVEIFGAQRDTVIPVAHAENLARSKSSAQFHILPGGHNDWSTNGHIEIRNP